MLDTQEKFIVQKIAQHKYEERVARGVYGSPAHDWSMAEKEFANYLLFKKQYSYIDEIIKNHTTLVGCLDSNGG
jgi:hypothetical protein